MKEHAVSGVDGNSGEEFYEANITLIPKTKIKTLLISLMNIDSKLLNKILTNQIQQCIIRVIQWDLFQECKTGSIFKN